MLHCVLTLIYSLYKWVNKHIGKKKEEGEQIIVPHVRRLREGKKRRGAAS